MKTLILLGSGEFTEGMEEVDGQIIADYKPKRIVILPTAAGREEGFYKWIEMGVGHFAKLGAKAIGLPVVNRTDTENPEYLAEIKRADWVYFSGGDPQCLYETIKGTQLWVEVLKRYQEGAILTGSSAGAIVFGKYQLINIIDAFEKNAELQWVEGLGLVDWAVMPHFDWALRHDKEKVMNFIKGVPGDVLTIAGIDENTAVIIRDNVKLEIQGKGRLHLFRDGKEQEL